MHPHGSAPARLTPEFQPGGPAAAEDAGLFGGYVEPGEAGWGALLGARSRLVLTLEAEALGLLFEDPADPERTAADLAVEAHPEAEYFEAGAGWEPGAWSP